MNKNIIDKKGKKIELDSFYTCNNLQFLKTLPDNCVDLIVTSPNYNNYRNKRFEKDPIKNSRYTDTSYDLCKDNEKEEIYQQGQINIINEMLRVLKPTGTICYNHKDRVDKFEIISPLQWIFKTNAILRQRITWNRKQLSGFPRAIQFYRIEEDIYLLSKNKRGFKWNKEAAIYKSIWEITPNKNNLGHNATFPTEIPKRCIEAFTNEGDIVLDPYSGTGTTAFVAKQLNRRYLGLDISENYNNIARKRLFEI